MQATTERHEQRREQRVRHVKALLETVNDPYQLPRHELADAGPATSKRAPCTACNRSGKVVAEGRIRHCGGCGGTGWRRRRKGEQEWDEYLGLPVRDAKSKLAPPPRPFRLDEDIRRLWFEIQRLERRDEPDYDDLLRSLQAKGWLEKRGSYRELRRALAVLEKRSPCVYGAVQRRYLRNVEARESRRFTLLVDVGVEFLAGEMRGMIRVPHTFAVEESQSRVKGIVDLAREGLTAGAIARRLGVPKRKVQRVLQDLLESSK